MNLNMVPKMGPPGPHAPLSKKTKEKLFHGLIFETVWPKSTAKADPCNEQEWQLRLVKQQAYRVGTGEARTCEAWFQLTFRPQKWNLKAHMWYQLSPFPSSNAAIAMQHHPGNIHQSVATPRYSATPWYVLIQLPNVIDTTSKR